MKMHRWILKAGCLLSLAGWLVPAVPAAKIDGLNALSGPDPSSNEEFVVAKVVDMMQKEDYRLMSMTEYNETAATIAQEQKLFQKAVQLAEEEWKKAQKNPKGAFAGRRLKAREIRSQGTYKDIERAQKKIDRYADEERAMKSLENRRGGSRKSESDLEREAELEMAAGFVEKALADLISKEPPAAAGPAALGRPGLPAPAPVVLPSRGSKFQRTPRPTSLPPATPPPGSLPLPGGVKPADPNDAPLPGLPDPNSPLGASQKAL